MESIGVTITTIIIIVVINIVIINHLVTSKPLMPLWQGMSGNVNF